MGRSFFISSLWTLLAALLFFFPITVQTDLYYDVNGKKAGFAIYLCKAFRLLGGYIQTYRGGVALHVWKRKAILVPYTQMDSERKRFSFVRSFKLLSFRLTTETGAEYLLPVATAHTLLRVYFLASGGDKQKIENNLWLTDGDVLRVSLHCTIYFSVFLLFCNLLKFIKEKIKEIWGRKIKKSIV